MCQICSGRVQGVYAAGVWERDFSVVSEMPFQDTTDFPPTCISSILNPTAGLRGAFLTWPRSNYVRQVVSRSGRQGYALSGICRH